MHVTDVPASSVVVVSADTSEIAKALRLIWGVEGSFWSYEPIHGAPRSGRVLFQDVLIEGRTVLLPGATKLIQVAEELMRLVPEARYLSTLGKKVSRGWEVRASMISGHRAVIVWAAHCPQIQDA